MADLTKPSRADVQGKGTMTYPIKDGETLFIGSYVSLENGRLVKHSDTSGLLPLGRVVEFDSPLQEDGSAAGNSAGTVKAIIDIEGGMLHDVPVAGASAATDVGTQVYLTTDNLEADLTTTPTTNVPAIGEISRFKTASRFIVQLYSLETMRGL